MKNIRTSTFCAVLAAATAGATFAETVTFNLVVKDKKGVAIKGLTASQFEVTDGGAKVQAEVKMVEGAEAPAPLFVLAFEGMGSAERRLARAAALDLLKQDKDPSHLYAVFMFSNQLSILQPFTADRASLAQAVDLATSGVQNPRYAEVHEGLKRALAADASPLGRVQGKMLAFNGKMNDDEASRRTIAFLNSLATGLALHPGRKAIVYVTAGLVVPSHLEAAFQGLVARANLAGVSFYPIDAHGVTESRQTAGVAQAVSAAGGQAGGGLENTTNVDVRDRDNLQDALRGSAQLKLRSLAEATGGLFIGDTNDPKPLLRQMVDDSSAYYEVTYDPDITNFDGSYRKTSVKVNAKDARVRDRDGYLALSPGELDLLPYELPLLKALASNPFPRDLAFRSGAVRLSQSAGETAAALLVEVPLGGLEFKRDTTAGLYAAGLTMLTQVKDAAGKVVTRYSRDLPIQGKIEQLPALQASNFNFREQFTVTPGRYVVETAVTDLASGKTGVRRVSFQAAAKPASRVALSAITMVRGFQPNQPGLAPDEPFQFQGGRIIPTLNQTLKAVKGAQMALFFVVYPDPSATGAPEAVIQYLKEGAELAKASMPLPAADATGKIPYVFSSPIETMPPGMYEIKVQVKQGASMAEESILVTIEP